MPEVDQEGNTSSTSRMGRKGMSGTMAAVIMIVVIVIVGGAGYVGLNAAGGTSSSSHSTCAPATSPVCSGQSKLNDLVLSSPTQPGYGQTAYTTTIGAPISANVYLTGGETATSYTVNWGDNNTTTQATTTFQHTYSELGTFLISGTADVGGVTHVGTNYLFQVNIGQSNANLNSGHFPSLTTSFSNGTSGGTRPWGYTGTSFTVGATYASFPTAAGYSTLKPSIVSSGGTVTASSATNVSASATYSFASAGVYLISFVAPIAVAGGTTIYENFGWTVYIAAAGVPLSCTACSASGRTTGSPHPGTIYAYEIAPGGATSLDPGVDYETVGGEILMNTYETLVNYNASSSATYVPVLSNCVPGPAATGPNSCTAQYGSDLNAAGSAGAGQYWTFPINSSAQFYDASTGAHWGVYPSDVMFSIARTLLWLEYPSQYVYNGWIIGQSLLPTDSANAGWDNALHTPWNNTPSNILDSMLINDTAYCPAAAIAHGHGCITFDADGSSLLWPFFLEFVQDEAGASVVPCGWYSAHGGGIPGWAGTSQPNGDGPCWLPSGGGQTTTNTSAWGTYVNGLSPTLYDNLILQAGLNPYQPQPQVRWSVVGSGPYYVVSVNLGQGYVLKANPYYSQPNCAAAPGCYPAPGQYAQNVYVFWDPDSTGGIEQYIAGQADVASFFPSDTPTILNLVHEGKVGLFSVPTLEEFPFGFNLDGDPGLTQSLSSETTNIPANFFANVGLRQFITTAFPYQYSLTQINSADGITYDDNIGGIIPNGLGNYYPTNISWPGLNVSNSACSGAGAGGNAQCWLNPSSDASTQGTAAWWWAQINDPSSQYYDAYVHTSCSSGTPCEFPIVSEAGAAPVDTAVDAWNSYIVSLSGGAINPSRWDPTFADLVQYSPVGAPNNPFTITIDGWLPDYPDPTDYYAPYYAPAGSYSLGTGLGLTMDLSEYNGAGCGGQLGSTFQQNFSALAYWANLAAPLANNTCQGTAYAAMNWASVYGATDSNPAQRILVYTMIEQVANKLALYMYYIQPVGVGSYANWINPSTITTNPIQPGQQWYLWNGLNVV